MATATERLEMRLSPEEKRLLNRAAILEGVKLRQFVLEPALAHARTVVADAERVTTSAAGYQDVLDALAHPPEPTRELLDTLRDYENAGIQWR